MNQVKLCEFISQEYAIAGVRIIQCFVNLKDHKLLLPLRYKILAQIHSFDRQYEEIAEKKPRIFSAKLP